MNRQFCYLVLFTAVATVCGGCSTTPTAGEAALAPSPAAPSASSSGAAAYVLDEREQKLNCKQLTGAMRVRILQIRGAKTDGTLAAQTLQVGATKIWGGGSYGTDTAGQHDRDRAQLEAYNRRLAELKCKTFDLTAELQAPSDKLSTPQPR